ncbi:hypothetical protein YC2023_046156 [Brassica napus]
MSRFAGVGQGPSLPKSSNDSPTFAGASSSVAVTAASEADGTLPCLVDNAKVEVDRSLQAVRSSDSDVFPSPDGKACSVPETPSHVAAEFVLSKKGESFKRSEPFIEGEVVSGSQEAKAKSATADKSRGRPHNRHRSSQSRSTGVTEQSNPCMGGSKPIITQEEIPKTAEPQQEVQQVASSVALRTLHNRNRSRARSRSRSSVRVYARAVSSPPEVNKSSALAVWNDKEKVDGSAAGLYLRGTFDDGRRQTNDSCSLSLSSK